MSRACRRWRYAVVVIALVFVALLGPQRTVQATAEADVERVVREFLALGSEGNLIEMYDRLHPDVRERVSRDAITAWYDSPEAQALWGEAETMSIAFGEWTWGDLP